MLITGLIGKVTGANWFSKHALLTAFFPNLAMTIVMAGLFWTNLPDDITKQTERVETWAVAFLFIAFVVALAYFTMNVQPALLRLYRGDWSASGPLAPIARDWRERWRRRIRKRNAVDRL